MSVILASGMAPAFVGASVLMPVKKLITLNAPQPLSFITRNGIDLEEIWIEVVKRQQDRIAKTFPMSTQEEVFHRAPMITYVDHKNKQIAYEHGREPVVNMTTNTTSIYKVEWVDDHVFMI